MSSVGAAVLLVGVLVFIHEFGHFIVAKACGVGVPVFSIGFGRKLVGVRIRGTEYRLSVLPFGGYVMLAGADPYGYLEDDDDDVPPEELFLNKPLWQRILVIAAGPAFNLALPFVVFTAVLMAGEPQAGNEIGQVQEASVAAELGLRPGDQLLAVGDTTTPSISAVANAIEALPSGLNRLTVSDGKSTRMVDLEVPESGLSWREFGVRSGRASATFGVDDPQSPAGVAGLETGEQITELNGQVIADWVDLQQAFAAAGAMVDVVVADADGTQRSVQLQRREDWVPVGLSVESVPSAAWGVLPAGLFVASVSDTVADDGGLFQGCTPAPPPPPSPAREAGVEDGDRFLRIDGQMVQRWSDVTALVAASGDDDPVGSTVRPLVLEVIRSGQVVSINVTPRMIETTDAMGDFWRRPVIGVYTLGRTISAPTVREYYSFQAALARASDETFLLGRLMVEQLGKLVTGEASVRKSVGGPVEMVRQASQAAQRGVFDYARLMGILSISLGIVNLLPVPVLDGGQLLFFLLEAIRGRPVSVALRERAQQIGVILMVLLMLLVLVMDLQKLFGDG